MTKIIHSSTYEGRKFDIRLFFCFNTKISLFSSAIVFLRFFIFS